MAAKVKVVELRKRYGQTVAADGVTFEVREGEIFGLLGPNGAGKTTTVECIIGLRHPDSGRIEVCGFDVVRQPFEVRQRIGAALQTTALQDRITPREALRLFASFYRDPDDPERLLQRFSLTEKADAPFASLSGGQRQRLALALAFVNRPEVVFLDEPTTGLDAQSRRDLHGEIEWMKREGHTVLLTTHYIDEAEKLCDRIAIIDRGRIIALGTPRELIAASSASPTVTLVTDPPIEPEAIATLPGVQEVLPDGDGVRFRSADVRASLGELVGLLERRSAGIAELTVRKATLEDVFIELTGERLRE